MKRFTEWLAESNIVLYSITLSIIIYLIKGLVYVFKDIIEIQDIQFREELVNESFEVTINLIVNVLILAPLLETLVFQVLFFSVLKKFKINKWIIVMISGLAFGAFHYYSVFYIIQTSLVGFIFMYMYILRAEVENKPFLSTVIAHSTVNLIVTIAVLITHFYKFGTWF